MKKNYFFALCCLFAASLPLSAQQPSGRLIPSQEELAPGETLEVDVTVANLRNLLAMGFGIGWNPDVLSFSDIKNFYPEIIGIEGSFAHAGMGPLPPGVFYLNWFHPGLMLLDIEDEVVLFTLEFLAVDCGSTALSFVGAREHEASFLDGDEVEMPIRLYNSVITVRECAGPPPQELRVVIEDGDGLNMEQVCLPVKVYGFQGISDLSFKIRYERTSLSLDTIKSVALPDLNLDAQFAGILPVSWSNPAGADLADGTTLFEMCFVSEQQQLHYLHFDHRMVEERPQAALADGEPVLVIGEPGHLNAGIQTRLSLLLGSDTLAYGEQACLPLTANQLKELTSLSFTLAYDPEELQLVGLEQPSSALPGFSLAEHTSSPAPGYVAFSYTSPDGQAVSVPDGEVLFEFCVEAVGQQSSLIRFTSDVEPIAAEGTLPLGIEVNTLGGRIVMLGSPELCDHPDYAALMAFYYSTGGTVHWTDDTGWRAGAEGDNCDPCSWYGIGCNEQGRVTHLEFSDFYVVSSSNNLTGELPAAIGQLSYLKVLRLDNNRLSGPIPTEIGWLSELEVLNLNDNGISGELPHSLSELGNLQRLELSHNISLGGTLPPNIGNLSKLTQLDLRGNQLTGPIPESIGNINRLAVLMLSYNQLSGPIPESMPHLDQLNTVFLNNNQLSGAIDFDWSSFQLLERVHLGNNQFSGTIPASIGQLSKLATLNLSNNQLSGFIPAGIFQPQGIGLVDLSHNQLTGSIPEVPAGHWGLWSLQLNNNQLTGQIPSSLEHARNLFQLQLNDNEMSGPLPDFLGDFDELRIVALQNNYFSGCFPDALSSLCELGFREQMDGFQKGYNFRNNPGLPWAGDFERFCEGEDQVGAPCNSGQGIPGAEEILPSCICGSSLYLPGEAPVPLPAVYQAELVPNPSTGRFSVWFPDASASLDIRILSADGRLAWEGRADASSPIDLQAPPGVYLVQVRHEGAVSTHRLVLSR